MLHPMQNGPASPLPRARSESGAATPHVPVEPKIIYPGTPVALLATTNPDGTANLAPMSSFWALGWTAMLGVGRRGQTCANLERSGECVINLAHAELWRSVEHLAPLTGRNPPPPHVAGYGGRFEADKFGAAGLTAAPSELVAPPRVAECLLQLEARVVGVRPLAQEAHAAAVEVRIVRVHASPDILAPDGRRIDPMRWRPLLYNFRRYHTVGPELGRSFREGT
jgi:flavin reductase (DIM6/NTAB) family NADH-FMN oxidoreductase RutF